MQKVKKQLNIHDLQIISHDAAVLRACNGIQPFQLANDINGCKIAVDIAIKSFQDEVDLIKERATDAPEQADKDFQELIAKKFEIEIPELTKRQFEILDINGDKEVTLQNGQVTKFSYREAYFNLSGLIIN